MEHRNSFRCPSSSERQAAQIRTGGVSCAAILLDESTGGFRISVDKDSIPCEVDDQFQLQTYGGWHDVQVVRHTETEEAVELGVIRLRDYFQESTARTSPHSRKRYLPSSIQSIGGEYLIGVAIIFLVPLMPFLFQRFLADTEQHQTADNPDELPASYPSLAGEATPYAPSLQHTSDGKQSNGIARSIASGTLSLGKGADSAIKAATRTTRHVFDSTVQLVHSILVGLPPSQQGRLETVVDNYSENPSAQNLQSVESLLDQPEFSQLQQLVNRGKVTSGELASLLYTEFHTN